MKAICIVGSPQTNGSTNLIVDNIILGMKTNGIEVKKYNLGQVNINYCLGCKKCYESNKSCVQKDDVQKIMKDLIDSNYVIIGSPSYWGDITGQLKVFFDRNTPYCDTNDNRIIIPKGKKGISIAIRAGNTDRENKHIIESIEHYYGHLGIEPIDKITVSGIEDINDLYLKEEVLKKAYEVGRDIIGKG